MVVKTQRKVIYGAPEAVYAEDPRPADSVHLAIPVLELGELEEGNAPIATTRYTGNTGETPAVPGPDGASFTSVHEMVGLDAPVGDGASPPAEDRFDLLMRGIAGTRVVRNGATATHTGTSLTVASDLYEAGDLVYLVDASGVGRWVPIAINNTGGSYTLAWDPGITGVVSRGSRQWVDDNGNDASDTLSILYDYDSGATGTGGGISSNEGAGQFYHSRGSRISAANLQLQADQQARLSLTWQCDRKLPIPNPTVSVGVNGNPAIQPTTPLRLACVWVDGTEISTASVQADFGLDVQPRPSTCNNSNRVNMVQMSATPAITTQPLFDEDLLALRRSQSVHSVLVQVGLGDQSWALYSPSAQVSAAAPTDRNGEQDVTVAFMTKTVTIPRWRMARA